MQTIDLPNGGTLVPAAEMDSGGNFWVYFKDNKRVAQGPVYIHEIMYSGMRVYEKIIDYLAGDAHDRSKVVLHDELTGRFQAWAVPIKLFLLCNDHGKSSVICKHRTIVRRDISIVSPEFNSPVSSA